MCVMLGELFDGKVRAVAVAVCTAVNWHHQLARHPDVPAAHVYRARLRVWTLHTARRAGLRLRTQVVAGDKGACAQLMGSATNSHGVRRRMAGLLSRALGEGAAAI
jgi:hypothetical protein